MKNNRAKLLNIAAGDDETSLPHYDYDNEGSTHASFFEDVIKETYGKEAGRWEVRLRKLDNVVLELGIQVALIKIDVEGFELNVIKGLKETLNQQNIP